MALRQPDNHEVGAEPLFDSVESPLKSIENRPFNEAIAFVVSELNKLDTDEIIQAEAAYKNWQWEDDKEAFRAVKVTQPLYHKFGIPMRDDTAVFIGESKIVKVGKPRWHLVRAAQEQKFYAKIAGVTGPRNYLAINPERGSIIMGSVVFEETRGFDWLKREEFHDVHNGLFIYENGRWGTAYDFREKYPRTTIFLSAVGRTAKNLAKGSHDSSTTP